MEAFQPLPRSRDLAVAILRTADRLGEVRGNDGEMSRLSFLYERTAGKKEVSLE